ncbi:MAG TPA: L-lactate dehydrogenase [Candidatus Anaerobutyricum stercoripullorum]|uniref:L-lactate dehydrogenase n=1 Tax=Candidatus Anaerobutyricum stercoripullorum TaxID=2838456 RepID=A0A9D2BCI7_9FIRM|nr:L-lactate dehydrogenase [Candidatus Anaerobutyricum stercoripullorum]
MKGNDKRKIVLVGTGMVGMSYAYALLNQNLCDELVLIDIDKKRAGGEAMDLNHGVAFSGGNMEIYAGEYADCRDADLLVLTAGLPQKEGQSRLDLLKENRKVFQSILEPILASGFQGIFLVATNPVDIMARIVYDISGFSPERIVGTGTALDTARLRYLLGEEFCIDPRNMHAYVMGEHGDSEFVPWSQAMMATKPIFDLCSETEGCHFQRLLEIEEEVRMAAYKIIEAKRATYYGIGMAMARITKAIFGDENSVLTVSAFLRGEYGEQDVFIGIPCVVNRGGVNRIVELSLSAEEKQRLHLSCETLDQTYRELG